MPWRGRAAPRHRKSKGVDLSKRKRELWRCQTKANELTRSCSLPARIFRVDTPVRPHATGFRTGCGDCDAAHVTSHWLSDVGANCQEHELEGRRRQERN